MLIFELVGKDRQYTPSGGCEMLMSVTLFLLSVLAPP